MAISRTELFYYFILFVYVLLWSCQLAACHLTHSLIILTESYINLYRILDVSLGIVHLRTQRALAKHREAQSSSSLTATNDEKASQKQQQQVQTLAGWLFSSRCTYEFRRLPLLGAFVNGLFLAALLMSAAIEGIQTCFHSGHAQGAEQKTILEENEATYPVVLVGFALVGLIMQYCSMRAHEMREEELCSDSLLDLALLNRAPAATTAAAPTCGSTSSVKKQLRFKDEQQQQQTTVIELSASNLATEAAAAAVQNSSKQGGKRQSYDLNNSTGGQRAASPGRHQEELPLATITRRSHEVAHDDSQAASRISLTSLRFSLNLESPASSRACRQVDSNASANHSQQVPTCDKLSAAHRDNWFWVRYLTSPAALVACAAVVYLADDDEELVKEVSDAVLAVTVVVLLFAASYPPMKRAGRILLQTAPDGVHLARLQRDLELSSPAILEVRELHVWSLTPRSNRVATCSLVLDKRQIESEQQVRDIVSEARFRFLDQNIKCTTIEPLLLEQKMPPPVHREVAVN